MELRAGYKQTEAGVVPDDWDVDSIVNLASITTGDKNTQDRIADGEYPFFVRSSTVERINSFSFEGEAVLTAGDGVGTGKIFHYINGKFDFHQRVYMVSNFGERLAGYFFYLHFSSNFYDRVMQMTAKSSVDSVRREMIADMRMPVPPKSEQRAIATALSDMDALLAKIDQLIAKKRDLKQAAMQQLLTGQTRLPGFSGEWELKPMKSLGQTYGGLAGKTKEDFGHGSSKYIPFMNVMTDTVIDPNWLETVDIAQNEAQNLAKKGDLFFNGSSETPAEVGFCSVLMEDIPNLYLNSFCFGFRFSTDAKVCGLFFAYWFRGADGRAAMSVLAQGATRYNIAKSAFMRLSIPQPSQEEQTAIATVLSDMDAELAALEARRDKTRALKQGMMQALLTGRIRLVGAN